LSSPAIGKKYLEAAFAELAKILSRRPDHDSTIARTHQYAAGAKKREVKWRSRGPQHEDRHCRSATRSASSRRQVADTCQAEGLISGLLIKQELADKGDD
jgi:hypothetical protein